MSTEFPYLAKTIERRTDADRVWLGSSAVSEQAVIGAFPIPQIQMLHPNRPAHFVEELFSHDENPSRINAVNAILAANGNLKTDSSRVGKAERIDRQMPHIAQVWNVRRPENDNLRAISGRETEIKKQFARIFDKNSFCYIFSSYESG